jgi:hypothetical protein
MRPDKITGIGFTFVFAAAVCLAVSTNVSHSMQKAENRILIDAEKGRYTIDKSGKLFHL